MFKRLNEIGSIIFISIIVVSAGYTILMKMRPDILPPDNVAEEFIEDVLEDQIGLPSGIIDLTPFSPEERASLERDRQEFAKRDELMR